MKTTSTVAVFGYGSLVAPLEILKRVIPGRPRPCYATLHNFRRDWECLGVGALFLGVKPYYDKETVNGAVIYVNNGDLISLDYREAVYHRQRVDGLVTNYYNDEQIEGPIYTYVPNTFAVERAREEIEEGFGFILPYYDRLVNAAFKAVSPEFYRDYVATTVRDSRIKIGKERK